MSFALPGSVRERFDEEEPSSVDRASSASDSVRVEGPAMVELAVVVPELELEVDDETVGSILGSGSGGGLEAIAEELPEEEEAPDVLIASGSFRFLFTGLIWASMLPGRSVSLPAFLPAVGGKPSGLYCVPACT